MHGAIGLLPCWWPVSSLACHTPYRLASPPLRGCGTGDYCYHAGCFQTQYAHKCSQSLALWFTFSSSEQHPPPLSLSLVQTHVYSAMRQVDDVIDLKVGIYVGGGGGVQGWHTRKMIVISFNILTVLWKLLGNRFFLSLVLFTIC